MSKGILPQGQAMSNRPTTKGGDNPDLPYPAEYAKLVGKFNNGRTSASMPNPGGATGNHPQKAAATSYPIGGKQPKVKEGP